MSHQINRRLMLTLLAGGAVLAGSASMTTAAQAQSRTGGTVNQMTAGLALKGYDTVAYFTDKKAVKGSDKITHEWGGAKWQFATAANRDAFIKEPTRYAPQFGGFCAWGVANGKLFDIDPANAWKVVDGKLYVIFNADVKGLWEKDQANFIRKGDDAWPKLNS
jgi:hypothetical protein